MAHTVGKLASFAYTFSDESQDVTDVSPLQGSQESRALLNAMNLASSRIAKMNCKVKVQERALQDQRTPSGPRSTGVGGQ